MTLSIRCSLLEVSLVKSGGMASSLALSGRTNALTDAWPCRSLFTSTSPLPFGPSVERPTMPSADFSPVVKEHCCSFSQFHSHASSQGKGEISRGKTQNLPCVGAGFITHTHCCGWRTSSSRADSSRVCHTSYPVFVHRPAVLDWASSRPYIAVTPLPFSLPRSPLVSTPRLLPVEDSDHRQ
jgi:hypothetical protein